MAKPYDIQLRGLRLLFARVLFLAISIVISSSGEDVQPLDTTERNLSSARRLRQARDIAIEPLLHGEQQEARGLHSKSAKAKSAKAKSAKAAKSAKWGKGEGKAGKNSSKGAKFSKSKGAKSNNDKAGKVESKIKSSEKSKSGKGEKKSASSGDESVSSLHSKSLDNDVESGSIDTATANIPVEETSVVIQSESIETNIYHDDVGVERSPDAQTVSTVEGSPSDDMEETASSSDTMVNVIDVTNNEDEVTVETATSGSQTVSTSEGSLSSATHDIMDENGTTGSTDTAQSLQDMDKSNTMNLEYVEGEALVETSILEVEIMEEQIEDSDGMNNHASSGESSTQEEILDTSNDSSNIGTSSLEESVIESAPMLESEIIEEIIEENEEEFEHLNEEEAVLDPSMESVE